MTNPKPRCGHTDLSALLCRDCMEAIMSRRFGSGKIPKWCKWTKETIAEVDAFTKRVEENFKVKDEGKGGV